MMRGLAALLFPLALLATLAAGCQDYRTVETYGLHHEGVDQHYDYPYWVEHDLYRPPQPGTHYHGTYYPHTYPVYYH